MTNVDSDTDPMSRSTGDADGGDLTRTFNYWSPAFAYDPYPLLRRLRADCPVARSDDLAGDQRGAGLGSVPTGVSGSDCDGEDVVRTGQRAAGDPAKRGTGP